MGPSSQGGNIFFAKYGGPSGESPMSGGGIIIFRVIRRHFLATAVDPAVIDCLVNFLTLVLTRKWPVILKMENGLQ